MRWMQRVGGMVLGTVLMTASAWAEPATRTVTSQVVVSASPADVWKAWTTQDGIQSWLRPGIEVQLGSGRGGGWIRLSNSEAPKAGDENTTTQHILAYQPERFLAMRPEVVGDFAMCKPCYEKTWTVVRIEPIAANTTRVTIESNGLESGADWDALATMFEQVNSAALQRLRDKYEGAAAKTERKSRGTTASVELGATPTEIFKCFTTSEGIRKLWSVRQADVDFRLGGQIRTRYDANEKIGEPGTIVNTILAYEPDRMLAIKATAPDGAASHVRAFCETGWTVITLEPIGGNRTRLTVAGYGYGEGEDFDKGLKFFDDGNKWTCEQMKNEFPIEGASDAASASEDDNDEMKTIELDRFVAKGRTELSLHKEIVVDAPPEKVFDLWTTEEGFREFLGVQSNVDLRIGGPMELYFGPNNPKGERGSDGCQILSYLPDRMLSYSWNAPPKFPEERQKRSWIVIFFHAADGGKTRVEMCHTGFGPHGEGHWDEVRAYFDKAWGNVLQALQAKLKAP